MQLAVYLGAAALLGGCQPQGDLLPLHSYTVRVAADETGLLEASLRRFPSDEGFAMAFRPPEFWHNETLVELRSAQVIIAADYAVQPNRFQFYFYALDEAQQGEVCAMAHALERQLSAGRLRVSGHVGVCN